MGHISTGESFPRTLFAVAASGRVWKISEGSLVFPVGMLANVQDRDLAYDWIILCDRSLKAYRCWRNSTLVDYRLTGSKSYLAIFIRFRVSDGLHLLREMEDERNIIGRRHSGYIKPDVPVAVDMINVGTHPEPLWRTLTFPLHFRASSQSLGDVLISAATAGTPARTVGAVAL